MKLRTHNTRKRQERTIITGMIVLLGCLLSLQAAPIEYDIQPRALTLGESAQCTFTLRGLDNPPAPQLPPNKSFRVSGPSRGVNTSMQVVNGKMQQDSTITYTYNLVPIRAGNFTFGPYTFRVGEKDYQLPAIEIRVVDPGGDGGDQQQDAVFAKLSTDHEKIYNQEVFDLIISIYTRGLNIGRDISLINMNTTGLSLENFQELNPGREVVGQQVYDVRRYRAKAHALTAGHFTVAPTLRVPILVQNERRRRHGFFDDPFFSFGSTKVQPVDVTPEALELDILALPEEGRPANYNGAVGQFEFQMQVKPREITAGDPVTVTMLLAGSGNIDNVTCPEWHLGDEFKMYDPRRIANEVNAAQAIGRKVFEQVVIPKTDSATNLPALEFSFFDPTHGRYRTITQGPFKLDVSPATNQPTALVQGLPAVRNGGTKDLGADIIYLHDAPKRWQRANGHTWYTSKLFLGLQGVPVLGLLGLFLVLQRRSRLESDVARARRLHAPKSARAGMRTAQQALAQKQRGAFFEGLWDALCSYFGHRLNLPPGAVDPHRVVEQARTAGMNEELADQLEQIFKRCEEERFAGSAAQDWSDADACRELVKAVPRILRQAERIKFKQG
jgi:hypothetical protein